MPLWQQYSSPAENLARRLGVSRSQLYQQALVSYLEGTSEEAVTAALDQVYAKLGPQPLDPVLAAMQGASLAREDW